MVLISRTATQTVYGLDVTATTEGKVTVQVPDSVITDDGGNPNRISNLFSIEYHLI
jgi:hypothetical protein